MTPQKLNFYKGAILNPQHDEQCDFYSQGLLVTCKKGERAIIQDLLPLKEGELKYKGMMTRENTTDFSDSVIMPGFFDMHFHWVQDEVRQMPKDSLLEWLEKYTFPTEMKFKNKRYAKKKAEEFFKQLTLEGTVGGACYSSIHEHATDYALKEARGHFVVGNVLMNMNSPKKLTQTESESLKICRSLIKKHGRSFCFTPRFAITTTSKVMKKGSQLADQMGCFKQTHLSETPQEIDFVLSLYRNFPQMKNVKSYTEIYHKVGMLGKRSLMGHGIHLSEEELRLLSRTRTNLIHCPTSNAPIRERGLGSGLFDFRKVESFNVFWALGSDIGGGPFVSMFDVMRSFVDQNKKRGIKTATYTKALYRATLAGAEIMGLGKTCGNLNRGKEATFIVVKKRGVDSSSSEEVLEKLILPLKSRRSQYASLVQKVFINGRSGNKHP